LAHIDLANILFHQAKLEEAIVEYRKAIEIDPNNVIPYFKLGFALQKQGKWDSAAAAYRKAIELDPKFAVGHNNLAWVLATCGDPKLRDPRRAVDHARKAVELEPANSSSWHTLGVAYYRAGEWKAAHEALDKTLAIQKWATSWDWFFLAMAHCRLGNKAQARDYYAKAVKWMEQNALNDEELRRFRGEAEQLLGIQQKNTKNTVKNPSH